MDRKGRAADRKTNAAPDTSVLPPRPKDLGESAVRIWDQLAPLAGAMGTLTPQTTPGFRHLVETIARANAMAAVIDRDGLTVTVGREIKAHPLLPRLGALQRRADVMFGWFRLAPRGRPVELPPTPAADDFDQFD